MESPCALRCRDPGSPSSTSSAESDNGLSSCESIPDIAHAHPWPSTDDGQWELYLRQEWRPIDPDVEEAEADVQKQMCKLATDLHFANTRITKLARQVDELTAQLAASTAALDTELLRRRTAEHCLKELQGTNASLDQDREQGRSLFDSLQRKFFAMRQNWEAERERAAYARRAAQAVAAEVVMISCCPYAAVARDLTCSGDHLKGLLATRPPATFFTAFLRAIYVNPLISLRQLLEGLTATLAADAYPRFPVLSASQPLDLNAPLQARPNPKGRTKLLLAAVHYRGQCVHLSDSVPEARSVKRWLFFEGYSAAPECLLAMADDGKDGRTMPTHANVMQGFQWLAQGAEPGDNLFFVFSGHGVQRRRSRAEPAVNALLPLDYEEAGPITEQMIFHALVSRLPKGVRLTVLMDCYHSGPALSLPYMFRVDPTQPAEVEDGMVPNPAFSLFKYTQP